MYEKDKKKKKEKLKARKKARKEEFKIIDFRAQYMTMELIKKENKGKVFTVKWKDIKLGEFVGLALPQNTIENIKQHKFSINQQSIKQFQDFKNFQNFSRIFQEFQEFFKNFKNFSRILRTFQEF